MERAGITFPLGVTYASPRAIFCLFTLHFHAIGKESLLRVFFLDAVELAEGSNSSPEGRDATSSS